MGIYKAEQPNLIGYVKAYNQGSADTQMEWINKNQSCFCTSCVEELAKNYSVYIKASGVPHTINQVFPGGVHAV